MPNIHPLLTHFPIALLTLSLVVDLLGIAFRRLGLERVGSWGQVLGTIGLAATVVSGLLARNAVALSADAESTFQTHEQIAFLVLALASGLSLWRIGSRMQLPGDRRMIYLLLSLGTVILLWVGAWHGGELVYRFGIGVQQVPR